jgi:hypothetical protein
MTDYIPPSTEAEPSAYALPDKASGLAVTTLVLGILSFCCCSFFAGIPALICGYLENGKIGRNQSSAKGKWMVITGMILGVISLILGCLQILWVIFFGGMGVLENLANR